MPANFRRTAHLIGESYMRLKMTRGLWKAPLSRNRTVSLSRACATWRHTHALKSDVARVRPTGAEEFPGDQQNARRGNEKEWQVEMSTDSHYQKVP